MDKKALRKKIIIIFIIAVIVWVIEFFITPCSLMEKITNPVFKEVLRWLRRILYGAGIIDLVLIVKDIAKFRFNVKSYKIWNRVKEGVKYKISYVEIDWDGIEDVINKVYNIYPNYTCKNVEGFLENLGQRFYIDENKKEDIAYFFISNKDNERIKNFLTDSPQLYLDCKKVADTVKCDFFKIQFSKETICKENIAFQQFINGIRFFCISWDKFDEHIYDMLKKFITCFNKVIKNKEDINKVQVLRILQIFWKIERKLNEDYIRCHDDMIAEQLKKWETDLNHKWIKSNINNICRELIALLKSEKISKEELILYISKANVLLSYWEKISFFYKFRLATILDREYEKFKEDYHKDDLIIKAIMLLLGAEILSIDFNPKEDLSGRMASLIISVAGLVLG